MIKYKFILFDLDGTLINTNHLIIDSFRYTLKKHLCVDVEDCQILRYFGEPLLTTLERFSKDKAEAMFQTYISYNESIHDKSVEAFENVDLVLKNLADMGCIMSIVTSKRKVLAKRGLELFSLLQYFEKVIACEDTIKHKPEPDPIFKALSELNARPEAALMVGDSEYDIKCAKNAGVKSVFVSWSEAGIHQNHDIEADYIINDIIQLIDIVKKASIKAF